MKKFCQLLLAGLFVICAGAAHGQYGTLTLRADISGQGTWLDGSNKAINPGTLFYVDIYSNNVGGDQPRTGWSSPFQFTLANSTHSVIWGDTSQFATAQFKAMWDMYLTNYVESWDGNLPDLYSFVGIGNYAGYPGNLGEILAFHIPATISCSGNNSGTFCIEQGYPDNSIYDWLFDGPVPSFAKTCWEIKLAPCGFAPDMDSCAAHIHATVNSPCSFQFHATDPDQDPLIYEITDGPGTVDMNSGLWNYTPGLSQAWQMLTLDVRAKDQCYYLHPCTGHEYCHTQVAVAGLCGDINNNGMVNILDVTTAINCLFKFPGTCSIPVQGFDVNNSGSANVLDITYMINYLYKGGPALHCPPWPQ